MNFKNSIIFLLVIPVLTCMLSACGDSGYFQDLRNYIIELKQKILTDSKKDKNFDLALPANATYHADKLRAPFEDSSVFSGSKNYNINPLLTYPLNVLRFVGTLSKDDKITAYIAAPDAKIYKATVGDSIGNHSGKITNILTDHIEVKEQADEDGSKTTQRTVTMQLKGES